MQCAEVERERGRGKALVDNVPEGEIQVPYKPCIAHFCLLTPTNRVKKKRKILVHLLCAAVRADVRSPGVECALTVARGGKKTFR